MLPIGPGLELVVGGRGSDGRAALCAREVRRLAERRQPAGSSEALPRPVDALRAVRMARVPAVMRKRLARWRRAESSHEDAAASVRAAAADHPGLLIIRAWIERESPEPLRAHIRLTTDVSSGFERSVTLTRPEDICVTVAEWLAECERHATSGDSPNTGRKPE